MDHQPTTPKAPDSTMLVTITVGQLRELIREEIQGGKTAHLEADRMLDAKEVSLMLSMSEDWLYRNAKKLPFTRKLGTKMLRFSYQGIVKWLATRKPS